MFWKPVWKQLKKNCYSTGWDSFYISKLSIDRYLFIYLRTYLLEINLKILLQELYIEKPPALTLLQKWCWDDRCDEHLSVSDEIRLVSLYSIRHRDSDHNDYPSPSVLWLAEESNAPGHKHSTVAGNVTWSSLNDTHTACSLWTHHWLFCNWARYCLTVQHQSNSQWCSTLSIGLYLLNAYYKKSILHNTAHAQNSDR